MDLRQNFVLRVIAKLLIPFIMLFALYVQFHGDYGPGGGFQAGVIFGAAFILYTLVYGVDATLAVVPAGVLRSLACLGVLIFGGVGVANMLLGGNFLDYDTLAHHAKHGQHIGIILVELGVGVTVTATMAAIFIAFTGRG